MKKQETPVKSRMRHSQQYKDEALLLAERVGIPGAAKQLGVAQGDAPAILLNSALQIISVPTA